jgi:hypothetical protein
MAKNLATEEYIRLWNSHITDLNRLIWNSSEDDQKKLTEAQETLRGIVQRNAKKMDER